MQRRTSSKGDEFAGWHNGPFKMIFSFLWVMFFVLVFLSIVGVGLNYVAGVPTNWLSSAWGAWGGIWIVLLIFFFFFRPWRRMYLMYSHNSGDVSLQIAKMRLAEGKITVEEYRKIVSELKKK